MSAVDGCNIDVINICSVSNNRGGMHRSYIYRGYCGTVTV
jgi:hypothetical protein